MKNQKWGRKMETEKKCVCEKNQCTAAAKKCFDVSAGRRRTAVTALFLAAFTWGTAFCVLKDTLDVFSPVWLLALRFLLAGLLLAVICIPRMKRMTFRTLKNGALMGVVLYFEFWFFTVGLQYTTASKSSFILASYIVILPLVYWIIRRKRPRREDIWASVLCMAGLSFILFGSFEGINKGDVISLFSALCYAVHIVVTGIYAKDGDGLLLNLVQIGTGGILGLVFAWISGPFPADIAIKDFGGIAYLAVFSTIVPYLLSVFGQQYVRTSTSGIILSFESVFGCILSVLVLGERPGGRFLAGAVLMMASFFIAERKIPPHTA